MLAAITGAIFCATLRFHNAAFFPIARHTPITLFALLIALYPHNYERCRQGNLLLVQNSSLEILSENAIAASSGKMRCKPPSVRQRVSATKSLPWSALFWHCTVTESQVIP